MNFRKISAKEPIYIDVKNKHEQIYDDFEQYAERLTREAGRAASSSGKAGSYARYLLRLIIFYEEFSDEVLEDVVSFDVLRGFECMAKLPAFKAYNSAEKHFPSATLACFRGYVTAHFAALEEYEDAQLNAKLSYVEEVEEQVFIQQPKRKPAKRRTAAGESYPRNVVESLLAKRKSNYTCEMNDAHFTFISAADRQPFVEAHHLIPMAAQDYFDNTIDFADNIVILCPNCHRKIHYAMAEEKAEMIARLYASRAECYIKYGIEIDQQRLRNFYGIL